MRAWFWGNADTIGRGRFGFTEELGLFTENPAKAQRSFADVRGMSAFALLLGYKQTFTAHSITSSASDEADVGPLSVAGIWSLKLGLRSPDWCTGNSK